MAPRHRFKSGDWLYACQRCGHTFYASQIRREWTGLRVCSSCWEPRHPQDFVRGRKDDIVPPFVNEPSDYDLAANEIISPDNPTLSPRGNNIVLSPSGNVVVSPSGDAVISEA